MSGLFFLRDQIRTLLVGTGIWTADQIILKRRTDIWNAVACSMAANASGQCLVIGVPKGVPSKGQQDRSRMLLSTLSIAVTLIELPRVDEAEDTEEDSLWEQTVALLLGASLGRTDAIFQLVFESFDDVEDKDYVIRQTVFKTDYLLRKTTTP